MKYASSSGCSCSRLDIHPIEDECRKAKEPEEDAGEDAASYESMYARDQKEEERGERKRENERRSVDAHEVRYFKGEVACGLVVSERIDDRIPRKQPPGIEPECICERVVRSLHMRGWCGLFLIAMPTGFGLRF